MALISINRKPKHTEEEKFRAAYALNLCMVSVSQIIEYNDIYILEQEYDAILNNLNLEKMPKDEALLDILKQLLNVITFFRIQEGDKAFLERDYQQKMKDAIWSAVPNLSVVVASGDPLTMLFSLATQVGIGYMNYRREKSKIQLEKEKEQWNLQRSAMEQLNSLRQELFDTAWRLADTYGFPDEYRLTERQISRYNAILMDDDYLRRYERLSAMAHEFQAYPPFFYFLGNAANMISQNVDYDKAVRDSFRVQACQHFQAFLDRTDHDLLRENALGASCALEYFDILALPEGETSAPFGHARPGELLERAQKMSGGAFDVLQLCATDYLTLPGGTEKAAELLRVLFNEGYNATVNAQLLSSLYVGKYIQAGNEADKTRARVDYLTLARRMDPHHLFPLPEEGKEDHAALTKQFLELQRELLRRKYGQVMVELMERYVVEFHKIMPVADETKSYPDRYFDRDSSARKRDVLWLFQNQDKQERYIQRLEEAHIETRVLQVLNELYAAACQLPGMEDKKRQTELYDLLKKQILSQQAAFDKLLTKIYKTQNFDHNDCQSLLEFSIDSFASDAFRWLCDMVIETVETQEDMYGISCVQSQLQRFCANHSLPEPVIRFSTQRGASVAAADLPLTFDEQLLGGEAVQIRREMELAEKLAGRIAECRDDLITDKSSFRIYIRGEEGYFRYIRENNCDLKTIEEHIVAILDNTITWDKDIIFTTRGVGLYYRAMIFKYLVTPVRYQSVEFTEQERLRWLQFGDHKFCVDGIDESKLYHLMEDLASLQAEHEKETGETGAAALPGAQEEGGK